MKLVASLIGLMFGGGLLIVLQQFRLMAFSVTNLRHRILIATSHDSSLTSVIAIVIGAISGSLLVIVIGKPQLSLVALVGGAVAGYFVKENHTKTQDSKKLLTQSLAAPSFIDMLSLCVASGMSLRSALQSTSSRMSPVLKPAWNQFLGEDIENGGLLMQLDHIARTDSKSVNSRIANTLLVASERGTSLVDVLHGLANEIRAENRRQLLEIAARKDVQMMLPVVFGVLPSVVAIALFPAIGALSSVF
ncbi:MAG: hypothetical protein RIS75_972 [Actinomycetota bacterium]|jgi:tight adherence protein C